MIVSLNAREATLLGCVLGSELCVKTETTRATFGYVSTTFIYLVPLVLEPTEDIAHILTSLSFSALFRPSPNPLHTALVMICKKTKKKFELQWVKNVVSMLLKNGQKI